MSRLTLCFSMYSPMSMRIIMRSSSNRRLAKAFASSVLPTPVGPRNRKLLPLVRDARPALLLSTAAATAFTAASWPTTRLCSSSRSSRSLSRSVCCSLVTGIPVKMTEDTGAEQHGQMKDAHCSH
eukprot:GHUV01057642.1.p1 GENE.GHUV01057642.1~~GHUV01057642.1.p1  ORF type:complete len:125 (-),score=22.90 GHUV01057642.1:902-1276(-)